MMKMRTTMMRMRMKKRKRSEDSQDNNLYASFSYGTFVSEFDSEIQFITPSGHCLSIALPLTDPHIA
jgi:hypothetical protein